MTRLDPEEGAMNTGRHINRMVLVLAIVISAAGSTLATELPPEPSGEYLVNEDVNIVTGLYTREYSLARNGIVDYMTARQIVSSEYNEYWNTVVETVTFPLFYWSDAGQTGHFQMWVDRKVEGCTCDILPYTALNER
jgi:hypothetical protein